MNKKAIDRLPSLAIATITSDNRRQCCNLANRSADYITRVAFHPPQNSVLFFFGVNRMALAVANGVTIAIVQMGCEHEI